MYGDERDETSHAGLCECGCGRVTRLSSRTDFDKGWIKGQSQRFVRGHSGGPQRSEVLYVVDAVTGCWLWQRNITKAGYGTYVLPNGKKIYAHRWAYEKVKGVISEGLILDHRVTCPKRCVNPDHLETVSQQINVQRGRIAKLNPQAVLDIRSSSLPAGVLAQRYGVGRRQIYYVRRGQNWGNVEEAHYART